MRRVTKNEVEIEMSLSRSIVLDELSIISFYQEQSRSYFKIKIWRIQKIEFITWFNYNLENKSDSNFNQYFKTTLTIYPENFMQIGWILRKFIPNRISGRISGRITGSASNFHQYFKTTINTYLRSFIQIRWLLGKFIRPDIRPDIRIVTKINMDPILVPQYERLKIPCC